MRRWWVLRVLAAASALLVWSAADGTWADSLPNAVRDAVASSPLIGEAAANRRAIDAEVDQARGLYMPRLDLQAFTGPQYINRPNSLSSSNNRRWRNASSVSLIASQTLFDGFFRANEIYRQAARVDGAAARVFERAEVVALDAIEAYVDLVRHYSILGLADQNIAAHRQIIDRIADLAESGTATRGDLSQAQERLAAAQAIKADVVRAIGEVRARFNRVVGREPGKLAGVTVPSVGIQSEGEAVAVARSTNPSLDAAAADIDAAEAEYHQTKSLFLPRIALEGRATLGHDIGGTPGANDEFSARVTLNWNLFSGGTDIARKRERRERLTEAEIRRDRIRREVDEAAARAWSDVHANDLRLSALRRQVNTATQVKFAYVEEFDAGLRSLLDLLDAENTVFNTRVQLVSAESIAVFARYQLIAATGRLLAKFGIAAPAAAFVDTDDRRYRPMTLFSIEPLRKW